MSKDNNELVPVDYTQLPAVSMGSDDGFADLAKGADFLGRLQLFSKGSAINRGKVTPGTWGIPDGEEVVVLGKTVDCIPYARRPKAIDLSDTEAIVTNYEMESDEFKRIAAESMQQDSGCMYGPSFLIYERSTGRFLEWFCGTKSTRSEAKKIYPFLILRDEDIVERGLEGVEAHGPLPFTMENRLVEKKRYSWHVPVVIRCSTPFTREPTVEKIVFEMKRFLNPTDAGVEKVDEKDSGRERAR